MHVRHVWFPPNSTTHKRVSLTAIVSSGFVSHLMHLIFRFPDLSSCRDAVVGCTKIIF